MNGRYIAAGSIVMGTLVLCIFPALSEEAVRVRRAPDPLDAPPLPGNTTACNYQRAQPFLIRKNYVLRGKLTRSEQAARTKMHQKSIRYRTEQYGYFEGFGKKAWNAKTPRENSDWTTFKGIKVMLHKKVIPALKCAEEQIAQYCTAKVYQPERLAGLRHHNSYVTNEVTAHAYGIAIDIDSHRNTCCGCRGRWAKHPLCIKRAKSIYERMRIPSCWVHAFERFGFYWLGHDWLQDTMHFEFLGDPDKVLKVGAKALPQASIHLNEPSSKAPGSPTDTKTPNPPVATKEPGQPAATKAPEPSTKTE